MPDSAAGWCAVSAGCGRRSSRDFIPRRSASRIPESPAGGVIRQDIIDKAAARFRRREHCALISVKRRQATPKIVSKRFCGNAPSEFDIPPADLASHLSHIALCQMAVLRRRIFAPPRRDPGRLLRLKMRKDVSQSRGLPSIPMVLTVTGIAFPASSSALLTIMTVPPQQGTSIRAMVTDLMSCR